MANQSEKIELQPREKQALRAEGTRPGFVFRPDVDILERKGGYVIYADLPGVDDSSVELRLDKGILVLDARLATLPESSWTPIHSEYRFGSYHREFRVSEDIDPQGVSATLRNGVLELELPKSADRQPRSIPVHAG